MRWIMDSIVSPEHLFHPAASIQHKLALLSGLLAMAPVRGTRSTRNQVTWTCKAGHTNNPQEYLIFDLPCFECRCGCGEKFDNDFEFCMGDIKVNNHDIIGVPYQQVGPTCVASGYAKIMEITKRVKSIIEKKDPDSVPVMCAQDLVKKYEASIGKGESSGIKKVVHMAQILKEQGILSEGGKTLYKVSNVSTVRRDDYEAIASQIANGFPLHGGMLIGKKLKRLKFCQIYKPPHRNRFVQRRIPVKGHAVVLIGAGRKRGRWYYFFLNSWRRFCVRRDSNGKLLRYGVGKIEATRLSRNAVRLSRYKETGTARSFEHQHDRKVSANNRQLLMSLN